MIDFLILWFFIILGAGISDIFLFGHMPNAKENIILSLIIAILYTLWLKK